MDLRVHLNHNPEAALLCQEGWHRNTADSVLSVFVCGVSVKVVVPCRISRHTQVHASVSFQSPAYPWLPSTWETATAFTPRRDRRGEMIFISLCLLSVKVMLLLNISFRLKKFSWGYFFNKISL